MYVYVCVRARAVEPLGSETTCGGICLYPPCEFTGIELMKVRFDVNHPQPLSHLTSPAALILHQLRSAGVYAYIDLSVAILRLQGRECRV